MRIDEELMEIWLNEVCDKVYVVVVIATTLLLKLGAESMTGHLGNMFRGAELFS